MSKQLHCYLSSQGEDHLSASLYDCLGSTTRVQLDDQLFVYLADQVDDQLDQHLRNKEPK